MSNIYVKKYLNACCTDKLIYLVICIYIVVMCCFFFQCGQHVRPVRPGFLLGMGQQFGLWVGCQTSISTVPLERTLPVLLLRLKEASLGWWTTPANYIFRSRYAHYLSGFSLSFRQHSVFEENERTRRFY